MRAGQLTGGATKLADALESLQEAWRQAQEEWDDATSRSFEENHLQPLWRQCGAVFESTNELRELLVKAQRDCDPDREY
jgi:hypothetical protein